MKKKHRIPLLILGGVLMFGSPWLGAYGQNISKGESEWMEFPFIMTSVMLFGAGIVILPAVAGSWGQHKD